MGEPRAQYEVTQGLWLSWFSPPQKLQQPSDVVRQGGQPLGDGPEAIQPQRMQGEDPECGQDLHAVRFAAAVVVLAELEAKTRAVRVQNPATGQEAPTTGRPSSWADASTLPAPSFIHHFRVRILPVAGAAPRPCPGRGLNRETLTGLWTLWHPHYPAGERSVPVLHSR